MKIKTTLKRFLKKNPLRDPKNRGLRAKSGEAGRVMNKAVTPGYGTGDTIPTQKHWTSGGFSDQ